MAVYSVSSGSQCRSKLLRPNRPRRRLLRISLQCQLWLHGPRHSRTREKHSGGECQKTRPSRRTSPAEGEPILSQLSSHHPSNHLAAREPPMMSAYRRRTTLTSKSISIPSTSRHRSHRCHRCVRIMTEQGVSQSKFQGRQGYIIIRWTLQTSLL